MFKRFVLIALLALVSLVGAHAHLADGPETVTAGEPIVLTFTEPIELLFSEFRVFAITEELAETLSAQDFVAFLERGEDEGVAGVSVTEDTEAAFIFHMEFAEALGPGTYVIVWNVLSIDTHSSREHHVFEVVEAN